MNRLPVGEQDDGLTDGWGIVFPKQISSSFLTQLCTKFQLLIKTKIPSHEQVYLSFSDVVFIMLIKVKMPTMIGILTFMSRINFVPS